MQPFITTGTVINLYFYDQFLDRFPIPDRQIVVVDNILSGGFLGMDIKEHMLADSLITDNTVSGADANGIYVQASNTGLRISHNLTHDNGSSGILLNSGASGNVITRNVADHNAIGGITMTNGATGNIIEGNSMHANGWSTTTKLPRGDARDLNPLLDGALQNTWTGNDCDTDVPAGVICGR
jgi:parallel beta-helix repeat protein